MGHECVNKLIVDRLLDIFGIEHLKYQLIHADVIINEKQEETFFCASKDFKEPEEDKLALDAYYDAEHAKGEGIFDFCVRNHWETYIYEMIVVDFVILNRNRHGANIEVLRNRRKKTLRLAPLFDHGISLLCRCHTEEDIAGLDNVISDALIEKIWDMIWKRWCYYEDFRHS